MRTTLMLICAGILFFSCSREESKKHKRAQLKEYTLAMVQMEVVGGEQELNLATAERKIREAAEHGAQITLLPEAMDFGWTHSSAREGAGPIPGGRSFEALSKAAKENDIYVCAGIIERDEDKLYNSAVIIDRDGKLLIRHRKLNELDFAHPLYNLGNLLNVAETELGRLGLLICADANAADFTLSKSLGMMGADIILSPSAWAVPPDHDNVADPYGSLWISAYRPISKIFNLWFVGVSNVGVLSDGAWTGWDCIGSSLAIDPDGNMVVQGPYGSDADTIIYIDVKVK